jgi:hypothetical protein
MVEPVETNGPGRTNGLAEPTAFDRLRPRFPQIIEMLPGLQQKRSRSHKAVF